MKPSNPIIKSPSKVSITIQTMRDEIKRRQKVLRWALKHDHLFQELPFEGQFYGSQVDFNYLTHPQIRLVLGTFKAGKWNKTPNQNGKVDYETIFDGMTVRCWAGEPPSNCRIIEEEVYIPAHTEIVKRLVCPKTTLTPA